MHLTLLGTGAMACLFGAKLSRAATVTLVGTWPAGLVALQTRGIELDGQLYPVSAARLGEAVAPADLVLVLVKAWQTERLAPYLPALLKPEGLVLSLQNGVGHLEKLGPRAHGGVVIGGATLLGPGRARSGGAEPVVHLAAPAWVVELFQRAGFETYPADNLDSLIWSKLVVNCGLNPLTALLRVPNGELLNRPAAAQLLEQAACECAAVARALGLTLPFADPAAHVRAVAQRTAANHSSMFQDIQRGAPTEIDALTGAVVETGQRLGVPTPVNAVLWKLVKASTL